MTQLIPVAQWKWWLFKVEYCRVEGGPVELTRYLVSTDSHVEGEVLDGESFPFRDGGFARWQDCLEVEVAAPRNVGSLYGLPISESGWAAGEREAVARGLVEGR